MNTWEVRYKLEKSGKYFFRRINAVYQHEANAIFDAVGIRVNKLPIRPDDIRNQLSS